MGDIVKIGDATLYHGDCLEILSTLDKVDCVLTDPPYFQVKGDLWDNQWIKACDFLAWVDSLLIVFKRLLVANGSLYFFASPQMAGRVEVAVRQQFNVLANIIWNKGSDRKGAAGSGIDVTALRTFWQADTERIIFAGQFGTNTASMDDSGYLTACEIAKIGVIGDYLKSEINRAGASNQDIAALFPSKTGGLTGCVSNWLNGANFPTPEQYAEIRHYLNREEGDYLCRDYEDLRRDYEDLRRDYEDLRRSFNITPEQEWGSVWKFPIVRNAVHPCEKPIALMGHIIQVSTNTNQVVLDPFMGSGTTGVACANLSRKFIGIEIERKYFDIACERIDAAYAQGRLFA